MYSHTYIRALWDSGIAYKVRNELSRLLEIAFHFAKLPQRPPPSLRLSSFTYARGLILPHLLHSYLFPFRQCTRSSSPATSETIPIRKLFLRPCTYIELYTYYRLAHLYTYIRTTLMKHSRNNYVTLVPSTTSLDRTNVGSVYNDKNEKNLKIAIFLCTFIADFLFTTEW